MRLEFSLTLIISLVQALATFPTHLHDPKLIRLPQNVVVFDQKYVSENQTCLVLTNEVVDSSFILNTKYTVKDPQTNKILYSIDGWRSLFRDHKVLKDSKGTAISKLSSSGSFKLRKYQKLYRTNGRKRLVCDFQKQQAPKDSYAVKMPIFNLESNQTVDLFLQGTSFLHGNANISMETPKGGMLLAKIEPRKILTQKVYKKDYAIWIAPGVDVAFAIMATLAYTDAFFGSKVI